MDKKITIWCIGVLIALFAFPAEYSYSQVKKPMLDSVFYYLNIDTANTHAGYLRMDSAGVNMAVDEVKGDYAMWYIKEISGEGNRYVLVNKKSSDSLRFSPPSTVEDTIATKDNNGILRYWDDMVFNEGIPAIFHTSYKEELITYNYFLTMSSEGVVNLSSDTSSLNYNNLNFIPERVTVLPDTNKYYRIVVDTLVIPDISDVFTKWNVLAADTLSRQDSIVVADTLTSGDFALWKFKVDFIEKDTTFFEIRNKVTDSILAFNIPNGVDTIAYIDTTSTVRHWGLPFFVEEGNKGSLMIRDTLYKKDYYLAWRDSTVILTSNKSEINRLKFVLVDGDYKKPFFDSTAVYSVKYITGDNAGQYLASNDRGDTTYVEKIFPHIPDGQFVVNKQNNYHLTNRLGENVTTAKGAVTFDSLKIVCDEYNVPIRNRFSNDADTVEIIPITSGDIENLKLIPNLGYKSFAPEELSNYSYAFSSSSVDSLMGRVIGYNTADSTVMILSMGDTARFSLQFHSMAQTGANAIGQIPRIERNVYSLRSLDDTTLFVAKNGSDLVADTIPANMAKFYLKEDTLPNHYFFVDFVDGVLPQYKILINPSKQLNLANLDSTDTHSFVIIPLLIKAPDEPDDFIYLKEFPDNIKGKGFYDLRINDPLTMEEKWFTKNYYDYAVLGKEGESMLRAGSFTPSDLHLWVDTARGTGFNPEKPSFYIVKGVDTTAAGFDGFKIDGYFLHVMDSTSLVEHEDYIFDDEVNEFNRANFVKAKRYSANELLLQTGDVAQLRDSVGFAGKNEDAINEYRFFFQESEEAGKYYIVTEAGYGDGGKTNARGYLSMSPYSSKIYFGPRGANAALVSFSSNTVSNEIVKPPVIEVIDRSVYVIGGNGQITIRNAMGKEAVVYNILGQPISKKTLLSDNESVPASRGIAIVKLGTMTRKVVVK